MRVKLLPFFCLFVMCVHSKNVQTSEDKLVQVINNFGIDLYKVLINTNDNLIFSGYSISTVLNMVLAGARKDTETELRQVLGYDAAGLSNNELKTSFRQLITKQNSRNKGYDLDVANSLWIQQDFNIIPEFKETLTKTFHADEQEVDFYHSEAIDSINVWVSEKTKGKIPTLFDEPLDPLTKLVLANAMYFKGTWVTKFSSCRTTFRYNADNTITTTKMMQVTDKFPYAVSSELEAQILELPYDGKNVSMFVFLPTKIDGLTSLQEKITHENIKNGIESVLKQKVEVKLPKFESSSTLKLEDVFNILGIRNIFKQGVADLSGINGKRDLFVSKVIQKAIIEVNEEGTVASAVTGIEVPVNSYTPVFTADHPFLYFIVHKPTGLHLFTGRYVVPF